MHVGKAESTCTLIMTMMEEYNSNAFHTQLCLWLTNDEVGVWGGRLAGLKIFISEVYHSIIMQ